MMAKTHAIGGACFGLIFVNTVQPSSLGIAAGALGLSIIGGLFPDIDLPTSKVGSKVKILSVSLNECFGHRGLFHSPLLYILLYLMLAVAFHLNSYLVSAFMIGAVSHLFLDCFNKVGIPLLYPSKYRFSLGKIKTGSKYDLTIAVTLLIVTVYNFSIFVRNVV